MTPNSDKPTLKEAMDAAIREVLEVELTPEELQAYAEGRYNDILVPKITSSLSRVLREHLPEEDIVTTKYGYNSSEKKFGFRIAITEVDKLLGELTE